jgi:hypothetical protein
MNALVRLLITVSAPFVVINLIAGLGAAIWLAILGEWASLAFGLLLYFAGATIISTAVLPGILLLALARAYNIQDNQRGFMIVGGLCATWTLLVVSAWCALVAILFSMRADSMSLMPHLGWAYAIAIGPLAELAEKDYRAGNSYTMVSLLFAQVGMLAAVVVRTLGTDSATPTFLIVCGALLAGKLCEFAFAGHEMSTGEGLL